MTKLAASAETQTIETTGITLSRERFMADYSVITSPGTYKVKAGSSSKAMEVANRDGELVIGNDGQPLMKHIVNFKAIPAQHIEEVKSQFKGVSEININQLNGLNLSANAIVREGVETPIPMKNQICTVEVGYVENKEGEQVLAVTAYQVPQAIQAKKFEFEDDFQQAE